jgi:hypothetical protein
MLDRRGRPAPWLDRKLTPEDIERITYQFDCAADEPYYDGACDDDDHTY